MNYLKNSICEAVSGALHAFTYETIYDGISGGAYNGKRYLSRTITSEGKQPIIVADFSAVGIDFEPSEDQKGGIIVFNTDKNTLQINDNKFMDFFKQKLQTIMNKLTATRKIDQIANSHKLVGWTVGHYLDGKYKAKNGKHYSENSLSVEIFGVPFETIQKIAEELCVAFCQESVLLKDCSNGRVLLVNAS